MGFMKQMKDMKATVDGIEASAQVVAAGNPTGMLNTDPIVPVELLVIQDGLPPRPVCRSGVDHGAGGLAGSTTREAENVTYGQ